MAVMIRLKRVGKPKHPHFRVVAIEKSRGPVGKPLEILGSYDPREKSSTKKLTINQERMAHWIKNGAKPSESLAHLIKAASVAPKMEAATKP
jgi:small subunit ribosomal protein S16